MPTKNAPIYTATLETLVEINDLDGMQGLRSLLNLAREVDQAEENMLDVARREAERSAQALRALALGHYAVTVATSHELAVYQATFMAKREALFVTLNMCFDTDLVQEYRDAYTSARDAANAAAKEAA